MPITSWPPAVKRKKKTIGPSSPCGTDAFIIESPHPMTNLAEALRVLGFVQRFGFGIPTARRELEKNGNPPLEFEVGPNRACESKSERTKRKLIT